MGPALGLIAALVGCTEYCHRLAQNYSTISPIKPVESSLYIICTHSHTCSPFIMGEKSRGKRKRAPEPSVTDGPTTKETAPYRDHYEKARNMPTAYVGARIKVKWAFPPEFFPGTILQYIGTDRRGNRSKEPEWELEYDDEDVTFYINLSDRSIQWIPVLLKADSLTGIDAKTQKKPAADSATGTNFDERVESRVEELQASASDRRVEALPSTAPGNFDHAAAATKGSR